MVHIIGLKNSLIQSLHIPFSFLDRDECATGDAKCHGVAAKCINEVGGYRCACDEGYRLSVDGFSCHGKY